MSPPLIRLRAPNNATPNHGGGTAQLTGPRKLPEATEKLRHLKGREEDSRAPAQDRISESGRDSDDDQNQPEGQIHIPLRSHDQLVPVLWKQLFK